MLFARLALARRELDRGDANKARATIDAAIAGMPAEMGDHPLRRAAVVWRVVALDAAHDCADAVQARAQVAAADAAAQYPWLQEANLALARTHGCATTP